jgi:hypothetical protein
VSINALSGGTPNTATSSAVQFNTVGDFYWRAFYSGNLTSSASPCNEIVHVVKVATAISTAPWYYPNDQATISAPNGGGALAGNVTFALYGGSTAATNLTNCNSGGTTGRIYLEGPTDVTTGTLGVDGVSRTLNTSNTSVKVDTSTTVYWRVTFASTNASQFGRNSLCVENINATLNGDTSGGTAP